MSQAAGDRHNILPGIDQDAGHGVPERVGIDVRQLRVLLREFAVLKPLEGQMRMRCSALLPAWKNIIPIP